MLKCIHKSMNNLKKSVACAFVLPTKHSEDENEAISLPTDALQSSAYWTLQSSSNIGIQPNEFTR